MTKYRKNHVVVDAVQWSGRWEDVPEIKKFTEGKAVERSDIDNKRSYLMIPTIEGDHIISPRDFVIRGVAGEYYLCKPDIFSKMYKPA